jgi:uncharacterized protein (DUF488 family)
MVAGVGLPFFTVGHSTRSIGEFIELIAPSEIGLIIDVRSIPRSRTNPQYNIETLPKSLSEFQIGYEHMAELGGRRPRAHEIASAVNGFWKNQSFHNYADYAMSPGFRSGLTKLLGLGGGQRCAVMCAEAVWWRCHRRIIADYLLFAGESVFHILGPDKIVPASLTKVVRAHPDGALTYPAEGPEPGNIGDSVSSS